VVTLLPVVPFLILVLTERRWVAAASAVAGFAAGYWVSGLVFPWAEKGWMWWLMLGYASLVSLAMAVAETVVAAILQRGRVFRGLFWTLAAHAAWLAVVFGLMAVRKPPMLLLVQTAMLGAAAATWGSRRRPKPGATAPSSG